MCGYFRIQDYPCGPRTIWVSDTCSSRMFGRLITVGHDHFCRGLHAFQFIFKYSEFFHKAIIISICLFSKSLLRYLIVFMNCREMEFLKLRMWRRSHQWSAENRNESATAQLLYTIIKIWPIIQHLFRYICSPNLYIYLSFLSISLPLTHTHTHTHTHTAYNFVKIT
jgi:hypothetical protein